MTKRICQGWQAAYVRLMMMAGLGLSLGQFRTWADDFPDRPRGGPPPPNAVANNAADGEPTPADPAHTLPSDGERPDGNAPPTLDEAEIAATRTVLNPLLIRDRRHRLLLSRGDESLRQGHSLEGFAHLQALLDAPHDAFYWPDASTEPRGTQALVINRLQSLPPAGRREYDRLNGSTAQALFEQYRTTTDRRLLLELFRRFGLTEAARSASVHELLMARDAGRTTLANEWARLLVADPYHWNRLTPAIRTLISKQLDSAQLADVSAASITKSAASKTGSGTDAGPSHRVETELSPPFPIPIWSVDFLPETPTTQGDVTPEDAQRLQDVDGVIRSAFQSWLEERVERRLPIASANEAIVAGDCVIVRGFSDLNAFDLLTGELRWKFRCASSLGAAAARRHDEQRDTTRPAPLDFDAHFSGNPVFGRHTTDGHRVYMLDRVLPSEEQNPSPGDRSEANLPSGTRYPNRLIALPVRVEESETSNHDVAAVENKPLWSRGEQSSLPVDELAGLIFLGRPLCVDNRVFVLAETDRQISLVALEAAKGRTLWSQGVALARRGIAADILRARTACTPLYSQGIVVCPTEVGLVVGVNAITGHLQWVYDHFDDDHRKNSGHWAFSGIGKTDSLPLPSHAFVHEGRVLHLPRTSDNLHCIDAATGAEIWRKPRLGAHAIGSVTSETVLLLGDRECRALAMADGRQQWATIVPEPAGLGLVLGDSYLLPTSAGFCLRLDRASGRIEGRRFNRVINELAASPSDVQQREADSDSAASESAASQSAALDSAAPDTAARDTETARLLRVLETAPVGNLVPSRDVIVAATARGVSVYPQARPKLERLQESAAAGDLSATERLTDAQLQLILGNEAEAAVALEDVLQASTDAVVCDPAERLLQEVLYAQLSRSADPQSVLDRLRMLAETDRQRARLLVRSIDVAIDTGDPQLLITSVEEFQTLPGVFLDSSDEDGYQVSSRQCVWERLSGLLADEKSSMRPALAEYLVARSLTLQHSEEHAELERFVRQFAGWPAVSARATQLARLWMETGRLQQAELLLLSDRFHREPLARWESRYQLATLYAQQGLTSEALYRFRFDEGGDDHQRSLPHSLVAKIPMHGLTVPMIGTSLVAARPLPATLTSGVDSADSATAAPENGKRSEHVGPINAGNLTFVGLETDSGRYRTALAPAENTWHVDISEHRCDADTPEGEPCVCDRVLSLHRDARRRIDPKLTGNLVVLDQRNVDKDRTCSRLVIGDRDTGVKRGEIDVPAAYLKIRHSLNEETGHVMVIGGDAAFGLSLLEEKLLWTVQPESQRKKPEKVHVGPVGSDYCVLQTSAELRVVDPATGQTLWVRRQLPPGIGLEENETGVIGDSGTLVVFDADQTGYTVYHMQSGRKLRRGSWERPDGSHRRQRWGVGRRLVDLMSTPTGTRLMVWDSRADCVEYDIPLRDRLICRLPDESHFAYVTSAGRLQILNVAQGDLAVDVPIPAAHSRPRDDDSDEFGSSLVAFADRDRFYVNLVDTSENEEHSTAATETLDFPHVRVRGRLLAVERRTGEIVWDRPVSDACVPLRADVACPMLLLVRRSREESSHHRRSSDNESASLSIEVLDAANGRTLAHRRNLAPCSKFVECPLTVIPNGEGQPSRIHMNLLGEKSRIVVAYHWSAGEPPIRTSAQDATTLDR